MRYHFFAGAVRPGDEHACLGRSYLLYYVAHVCDSPALADHLRSFGGYAFAELSGLLFEGLGLQRVLGGDENTVEVQGFEQEVIRPHFERLHRRLYVPVSADHHYRTVYGLFAFGF